MSSQLSDRRATKWSGRRIVIVAIIILLIAAMLACNYTQKMSSGDPSVTNGSYWACATPTPIPPEIVVLEWAATSMPKVWVTTTPIPTATPFYRVGEYFKDQVALHGELMIGLVNTEWRGNLTVATFEIRNLSNKQITVMLTRQIFAIDGSSAVQQRASDELQQIAALRSVAEIDATLFAPLETRHESLAFAGNVNRFGFNYGVGNTTGYNQAVYFNSEGDKVPCPNGPADKIAVPPPQYMAYSARPRVSPGRVPILEKYYLSSDFGCGTWGHDPPQCGGGEWFHHGLDLALREGVPIYALPSGVVFAAGWSSEGYGNYVVIRSQLAINESEDDYLYTLYGHLAQSAFVGVGQYVECGVNIGVMGTTGNSTGPHLHWEMRRGDSPNIMPGYADQHNPADSSLYGFLCPPKPEEYRNPYDKNE